MIGHDHLGLLRLDIFDVQFMLLCPVCPYMQPNNSHHLLFVCSSLSTLRTETGISSFLTSCSVKDIDSHEAFALFITGFDSLKQPVRVSVYFERAKCMNAMRELWLSKW